MFLTEAEILDTPLSLNYTCQYFEKNKKNLEQFFQENQQKKFTILAAAPAICWRRAQHLCLRRSREPAQMRSPPATTLWTLCSGMRR